MTEPGIVFEGVWKKFRRGELHDSLRDLIPAVTKRLVRRTPPSDALEQREFWALSDVSFEVKPGEALGIIGANGAGKSTALKILNRILQPTRGRLEVRGRAGALIEISAGFHQDLTGRENVYLQGAIMGMRKAEIVRKFDQIVEFAGIADFIDTPVKRYSSGMNARLGFSIAAHLDPDVLIIDEVLAVGDFSFQDRAFGRIREMVRSGVPVVIVSHQLDRVAELCTKAILLSHGQVIARGTPQECITKYITPAHAAPSHDERPPARIDRLELLTPGPIRSGGWMRARVEGEVFEEGLGQSLDPFCVRVRSAESGGHTFETVGSNLGLACPPRGPFSAEVELQFNTQPGLYSVEVYVYDPVQERDVALGPVVYLQVAGGLPFYGGVQMNPTIRVLDHSPAGV